MLEDGAATPTVAVIGGGPAGLMAAEVASAGGLAVTVYDRMPTLGRKFLMAGRGGLNLTHGEALEMLLGRYGAAEPFLASSIRRFDNAAVRTWAEALGQPTFAGSSGRVFPKALKASPLLRAWLARLERQGVRFVARRSWVGFATDGALRLAGPDGTLDVIRPAATILALGGASWPRLGADGGWVPFLRAAGVVVHDLVPANSGVDLRWSTGLVERFAGRPLKTVSVRCGETAVRGDLVVTAYGLEGGPVYSLGPTIRAMLAADVTVRLTLDLKPDTTLSALAERLGRAMAKGRSRTNALRQAGLPPVAVAVLREVASVLPAEPPALAALVKAVPLDVAGQQGLARAISSAGGIDRDELDAGLMLKRLPGIFAAGEMIDWEAPTGGYLLQACFATGRTAAEGAIAWLERSRPGC